jgi:hypothetical protein
MSKKKKMFRDTCTTDIPNCLRSDRNVVYLKYKGYLNVYLNTRTIKCPWFSSTSLSVDSRPFKNKSESF